MKVDEQDTSYSIFNREIKLPMQPRSLNVSTQLYDQIHLSPSTGRSEPIPGNESENINSFSSSSPDSHKMEESDDTKKKCDVANETEKNNSDDFTYAVRKRKGNVQMLQKQRKWDTTENAKDQLSHKQGNIEEMYAVIHKQPKNCENQEKSAPPVLYIR